MIFYLPSLNPLLSREGILPTNDILTMKLQWPIPKRLLPGHRILEGKACIIPKILIPIDGSYYSMKV
jgi:hypothetical protein